MPVSRSPSSIHCRTAVRSTQHDDARRP